MNNTEYREIVTVLTKHFSTSEKRRYYLDLAFMGDPLLEACPAPDANLTARSFTMHLVRVLTVEQQETQSGEASLPVLLSAIADDLRGEPARELRRLASQLPGYSEAEQRDNKADNADRPRSSGVITLALQGNGQRLSLRCGDVEINDGGAVLVGEMVTVRFTIRNDDLHTIGIQALVIAARGPGAAANGWNAPILPFAGMFDILLTPGESHVYEASRAIPEVGDYFIEPNLQDLHGGWHGITPFTRINFTVVDA